MVSMVSMVSLTTNVLNGLVPLQFGPKTISLENRIKKVSKELTEEDIIIYLPDVTISIFLEIFNVLDSAQTKENPDPYQSIKESLLNEFSPEDNSFETYEDFVDYILKNAVYEAKSKGNSALMPWDLIDYLKDASFSGIYPKEYPFRNFIYHFRLLIFQGITVVGNSDLYGIKNLSITKGILAALGQIDLKELANFSIGIRANYDEFIYDVGYILLQPTELVPYVYDIDNSAKYTLNLSNANHNEESHLPFENSDWLRGYLSCLEWFNLDSKEVINSITDENEVEYSFKYVK